MPEAEIFDIRTGRTVQGAPAGSASDSILSLCAAFNALQFSKAPLFDMPDGYERECAIDAVDLKQEPMVYRLAELRATNMEEHCARARSLALYLGEDQLKEDAESSLWHERMTAAILRDLAAVCDADAALLDLCRQFDIDDRALQQHDWLCAHRHAPLLDDSAFSALLDRWHDILSKVTALPAGTSAGLRAKAGALRLALIQEVKTESHRSFEEQAEDFELLAMSLALDLATVPT